LTAAQAKAARSKVRSAIETVRLCRPETPLWADLRTIGLARAKAKIGLSNIAYNFTRLTWLQIKSRCRKPAVLEQRKVCRRASTISAPSVQPATDAGL
jgi:hypothetical protein